MSAESVRSARRWHRAVLATLLGGSLVVAQDVPAAGYDGLADGQPQSPATATSLTLISSCIYITIKHLPEAVAVRKGYFAREGLHVTLKTDTEGANHVLHTVGTDDYSIGIVPPVAILAAIDHGADLKIVGRLHGSGATEGWWVVRKDSAIQRPEDLKGARIGITRPGFPSDVQSGLMAKMAGLDPATDILRLPYGSLPGVLQALDRGEVDVGLVAAVPHDIARIRNGEWRIIKRWGEGIPGWFDLAVVVNGNVVREHPEWIRAFFTAVGDARDWIIDNRESPELLAIAMAMLDAGEAQRNDVAYLLDSLMAKDLHQVWDFNVPVEDLRAMAEAGVNAGQLQDVAIDWSTIMDLRLLYATNR
ncbi:MAG: ABC transporter substrate-binding protein [Gammaproteobacteria bacterium]|nr:ABC transporter substrate-binding protein [Gammaproteobacteria bacterium]